MTEKYLPVVCAALLGLIGCDGDPGPEDSGMIMIDTGPGDLCAPPMAPYGTSQGSNFSPFTLQRCDGTDYEFYGEAEGYCDASFTVVSIAAGWCGPCRMEAGLMQEYLVDGYAAYGVRIIVALIQNNDYMAPDLAFCEGWQTQYGLSNAVLIDPVQVTQRYFPAGSLPATVIVDSNGVIVHREYGVSMNLNTVRAELDRLLGL